MKTLLILSAILCAALSIEAATGETESLKLGLIFAARLSFCLDGWHSFRGNCYLLVNTPETWRNAESYCASFEGSLVSVHSIWEYRFLQRLAKTGGHSLAWMGGYFFQGDWRWEDGTLFDYSNWEPLSSTSSYQCLQLNSDESKGWSNHGCSMRFPFICELRSNC
uniref:C-type lectin domain-containing protein n=1 Tax=Myripristis murdjan TaxID=586833 RepID=A0A668A9B9_9TELE